MLFLDMIKDLREDRPREPLYYVSLIRAWFEVRSSIGIRGCKFVYCIDFSNFDTSLIRVLSIIAKRSLRQCFHLTKSAAAEQQQWYYIAAVLQQYIVDYYVPLLLLLCCRRSWLHTFQCSRIQNFSSRKKFGSSAWRNDKSTSPF